MSTSHNLNLPYVAAGQAQKHVTVNEGLLVIDCLMHLLVAGMPENEPPAEPGEGSRWLVGAAPTGVWAGKPGQLAVVVDGGWRFHQPRAGWLAVSAGTGLLLAHDGDGWSEVRPPSSIQDLERLGLGGAADADNPLTVHAANALFTAPGGAGGGNMRLKLNRTASDDTAGLLYQTAYEGQAEIGLLGDDNLTFKVSSDGSVWRTALTLDRISGVARLPCNPKFRASLNYDAHVPADAWTRIPFNVADHDPLTDFDVVDHAYTAPVDGFYVFGAQVGHKSDGSPPATAFGAFFVNGAIAEESEMRCVAINNNRGVAVLTLARHFTAGTTVDVRVWFDTNDSSLDDVGCQLWGMLVP